MTVCSELIRLDLSNYFKNSNSLFAEEILQNYCDLCFHLLKVQPFILIAGGKPLQQTLTYGEIWLSED